MNEAELLFTGILNCDRISLYLNRESHLDFGKSKLISSVLKRRIIGEPIQYILGETEFFGLEFRVNPDVFIPRPETEILVETVLKIVSRLAPACPAVRRSPVCPLRILDLGTGSGCIVISLAKFLPHAKIDALDISKGALKIARENAEFHKVEINFIDTDLLTPHPSPLAPYDIIVSNPPYIPSAEIDKLQPEIGYEPRMALDGGSDGLDFYRRIISNSPYYLKENGFLIMEMGFNQKEAIKNIFQNSGNFEIVEIAKDYHNIDRVIVTQVRKDG